MSTKRSKSDSSNSTKKRKTLTLELKHNIVKNFEGGMKTREIAQKFNLSYTTVHSIIKDKNKILDAVENAQSLNSSLIRKRHGIIADTEILLIAWCQSQINVKDCPIDQNTICNKAKQIFDKLKQEAGDDGKNENFVASNGWFCRFKKRCNWHKIAKSGEAANADKEAAFSFPDKLKGLIEEGGYSARTVFNVDETGLFWKKMPKSTFIAREKKTFLGFEATKDRLTVMLGGNAAGDCKLKPLLVYFSENPKALKNKSKSGLPVIWKSNCKACVTASLFEEWFGNHFIPETERYCKSQNLPFKVILVLDNAPGHPPATLIDFDHRVKVIFLPSNTTSVLQPMDSVMKTFKAYYTRRSFARLYEAMTQDDNLSLKDFWKNFNVLDAVRIIVESWAEVSSKTFEGVWKKLCPILFTQTPNTAPESDQVNQAIEDVVTLARQINLEVDRKDVNELLESHGEELTLDDLIEMQQQNAVEDEDSGPAPPEKLMTVAKLTEGLDFIKNGIRILEEIDSNEERVMAAKQNIQRSIASYVEILRENEKSLIDQTTYLDFMKPSTSNK